jgi:WhiB family transcriptional regulator, redox-sensing transcriptional regulator
VSRMPQRMLRIASGAGGSLDWMSRGACGGVDPELFFPAARTAGSAVRQAEAAKAVCGRCAVRANCLSYALETMPEGIWGGTTDEERRAERGSWARRASWLSGGTVSAAMAGDPAGRAGRAAGQRVASGRTA